MAEQGDNCSAVDQTLQTPETIPALGFRNASQVGSNFYSGVDFKGGAWPAEHPARQAGAGALGTAGCVPENVQEHLSVGVLVYSLQYRQQASADMGQGR